MSDLIGEVIGLTQVRRIFNQSLWPLDGTQGTSDRAEVEDSQVDYFPADESPSHLLKFSAIAESTCSVGVPTSLVQSRNMLPLHHDRLSTSFETRIKDFD
jgi:hypothetical protein